MLTVVRQLLHWPCSAPDHHRHILPPTWYRSPTW